MLALPSVPQIKPRLCRVGFPVELRVQNAHEFRAPSFRLAASGDALGRFKADYLAHLFSVRCPFTSDNATYPQGKVRL